MPRRPRAAAAARTAEHPALQSPQTPPRRLRRASFRHSLRCTRDLARRRAHFERIAAHHVAANTHLNDRTPLSSATETPSLQHSPSLSTPSQPASHVPALSAHWAHRAIQLPDVALLAALRALLSRLHTVVNLVEAAGRSPGSGDSNRLPQRQPHHADDFPALADALSTDRFITHHDDAVKLFTACCMAELLRICAPDPPVSQRKLAQLSSLFIEQLAVLVSSSDPFESFRFSLLEQLATVKTFVIFCDDDAFVCDVFACFYAIVRSHQSEKSRQYLAAILISLLDEADGLRKDVLDAMIAPLVPALRYSTAAVALAESVLYGASGFVQVPLCSMLNESLRCLQTVKGLGTPEKKHPSRRKSPGKRRLTDDDASLKPHLSEHHEHIAQLLVSINRIAPDVLIYVIPSLETLLESSDHNIRLASVQILARLFTSRVDVIDSYPSLFAEFLNRQRDVNAHIRAQVAMSLGALIVSHPKHAHDLIKMLEDRAIDKDDHVRCVALESVGKCFHRASDSLLRVLASRLCDRKAQVRKAALAQICHLFTNPNPSYSRPSSLMEPRGDANHSMDWQAKSDSSVENGNKTRARTSMEPSSQQDVLETRMLNLSWLPDVLIRSHMALSDAGDQSTVQGIERLIFEHIPAVNKDEGVSPRAGLRRLSIFLSQLSESVFSHLLVIVRNRWNTRAKLITIAHFRQKSRKSATSVARDDSEPAQAHQTFSKRPQHGEQKGSPAMAAPTIELRNLAFELASLMYTRLGSPGSLESCQKLCMSLATAADLKIFDRLLKAVHPSSTHAEVFNARQDVVSRLGSKSAEGEFVQHDLFPVCCPGVFSGSFFSAACNIAKEESSVPVWEGDENGGVLTQMTTESGKHVLPGILRFLNIIGSDCNAVLDHKVDELQSLISMDLSASDSSADVILCGLRLLCQLPLETCSEAKDKDLLETVRRYMTTDVLIRPDRGALLSKWGCRAFIHVNRKPPEDLLKLGKDLTSKLDSFTGDIEAIIAPVAALTQLAKHAPKSFRPCALECFDFSRALLSGTMNAVIQSANETVFGDAKQTEELTKMKDTLLSSHIFGVNTGPLAADLQDKRALYTAEIVQRAIKLFVYSLAFQDEEETLAVIDILLRITDEKHGDVFSLSGAFKGTPGDETMVKEELKQEDEKEEPTGSLDQQQSHRSSSEKAVYAIARLSAGRAILYLSRQKRCFRRITPNVFVSALLLAQDESPVVRLSFAKSVFNGIVRKVLPLRWSVALALMAVEPVVENFAQARSFLAAIFRYRRRVYNHARQQGKPTNLQFLPESAVADLIWSLAHLPGVEIDQESGFAESRKCLELFLDRLLESNEHAGILNEYIESLSIAQVASDFDGKHGRATEFVIELSRIAGAILRKKQAGRKWNLSEHPGRVALPADMFQAVNRKAEETDVVRPSLVELARKLDDKEAIESTKSTPSHVITDVKVSSAPSSARARKRRSRVVKSEGKEAKLSERLAAIATKTNDAESEVAVQKRETPLRRSKRESRGKKRSSQEVDDGLPSIPELTDVQDAADAVAKEDEENLKRPRHSKDDEGAHVGDEMKANGVEESPKQEWRDVETPADDMFVDTVPKEKGTREIKEESRDAGRKQVARKGSRKRRTKSAEKQKSSGPLPTRGVVRRSARNRKL